MATTTKFEHGAGMFERRTNTKGTKYVVTRLTDGTDVEVEVDSFVDARKYINEQNAKAKG